MTDLQSQTLFAPTPDDSMHVLEQPTGIRKRSLCALTVDVDDAFVISVTDFNVDLAKKTNNDTMTLTIRGFRVCRSCLEKLGGRK